MEKVQIIEHLKKIEIDNRIKILYACETGSRAWGFPSPDSDYDIRFIYMHEPDWYLKLNKPKDTIEVTLEDILDISGWDIRKSLVLLKKSNVPLIERFTSPIEYSQAPNFKDEFMEIIKHYYSPTAVFYHHYSLAKKFEADYLSKEKYRLKSLFYLLRSLLSCNWILNDKSVLPMHMNELVTYIDDAYINVIYKLIKIKSTVNESYMHDRESTVDQMILKLFSVVNHPHSGIDVNKSNYDKLNAFFLKYLNEKHNY